MEGRGFITEEVIAQGGAGAEDETQERHVNLQLRLSRIIVASLPNDTSAEF
jgi:hypothetical protein